MGYERWWDFPPTQSFARFLGLAERAFRNAPLDNSCRSNAPLTRCKQKKSVPLTRQWNRPSRALLFAFLFALSMPPAALPAAQLDDATRQLSHDIFKQLIEINTTDSSGSTTIAADAMAQRLKDAGFPASDVLVLGPSERKGNMVARFHGSGRGKPILLIGHLDVVEARREDWSVDPFEFLEKDDYFYGRGTQDMKSGDAILVTTFIRLKKENYQPDRDVILALTADEEGGKANGIDWLLKNHQDLIAAEYVLNSDGGGIYTRTENR